jgi:hypothetical protein
VDGRWYTRDRDRWVYYAVEPEPLYRYRVHVQRAPRAPARVYRRAPPRRYYSAPPAHSPPAYAPPARRVR